MLNFKYILFLVLISFTFQFDHCLQEAQICQENIRTRSGSIANCIDHDNSDSEVCYECANGYAISYGRDSCISFPLCYYLLEGNKNCGECYPGYYWNGKECTRISIDNWKSLDYDGTHCEACTINYKLNSEATQCELITIKKNIDGCEQYGDDGYCTRCNSKYTASGSGSGFTCTFNGCSGDKVIKYCSSCEIGYYTDRSDGNCKSYSGNSNNSRRNEARNAFLIFLFAMLL